MAEDRKAANRALVEDPTVSVDDTAELLGVSRNNAYGAVREGRIPSIRVGRSIRVPTAPLRRMLGLTEGA